MQRARPTTDIQNTRRACYYSQIAVNDWLTRHNACIYKHDDAQLRDGAYVSSISETLQLYVLKLQNEYEWEICIH